MGRGLNKEEKQLIEGYVLLVKMVRFCFLNKVLRHSVLSDSGETETSEFFREEEDIEGTQGPSRVTETQRPSNVKEGHISKTDRKSIGCVSPVEVRRCSGSTLNVFLKQMPTRSSIFDHFTKITSFFFYILYEEHKCCPIPYYN